MERRKERSWKIYANLCINSCIFHSLLCMCRERDTKEMKREVEW